MPRQVWLDVYRGLAVVGMCVVNYPGSWATVYWPLAHAGWNGVTPADFVFPAFLFAVGLSIVNSSLATLQRKWTARAAKIVRRSAVVRYWRCLRSVAGFRFRERTNDGRPAAYRYLLLRGRDLLSGYGMANTIHHRGRPPHSLLRSHDLFPSTGLRGPGDAELHLAGEKAPPAALAELPIATVIDETSRVVPPASSLAPLSRPTVFTYVPEVGVALQHVGPLVGRHAHRELWPKLVEAEGVAEDLRAVGNWRVPALDHQALM